VKNICRKALLLPPLLKTQRRREEEKEGKEEDTIEDGEKRGMSSRREMLFIDALSSPSARIHLGLLSSHSFFVQYVGR
jgi:hypothetical protein